MTAEEFFNKRAKECGFENWVEIIVHQEWKYLELFPIEFAQYHIKEALKAAGEIVENELEKDFLNKNSILNAYPESNII